jgi:NTP pyrophosphatase (non-canonical NTP hydrolase)
MVSDFTEYQLEAHKTWALKTQDITALLSYAVLGLTGEAGEVANAFKKAIRDDGGKITEERRTALVSELGDVLWYLSQVAYWLDIDLDDLAAQNLAKLADRQRRNVIAGSGDNR